MHGGFLKGLFLFLTWKKIQLKERLNLRGMGDGGGGGGGRVLAIPVVLYITLHLQLSKMFFKNFLFCCFYLILYPVDIKVGFTCSFLKLKDIKDFTFKDKITLMIAKGKYHYQS